MLDEASQVIAYSHELEHKSRELMAATAELRAANERLKELDRLKDDFVSTVTHELRTPLTSIRAFSEILHDNPGLDADERQKFLNIIIHESERLTRLINQVLDLAKLESGRAEWQVARSRCQCRRPGFDQRDGPALSGQECRARDAPSGGCAVRQSGPRSTGAGADQPAVQRGEVRPARRRACRGRGRRRGRNAARARHGRRARHCRRKPAGDLREVPPGGRHDDREAPRNRARTADQPTDHRAFRRPALGGKRAGRGRDIHIRTAGREVRSRQRSGDAGPRAVRTCALRRRRSESWARRF